MIESDVAWQGTPKEMLSYLIRNFLSIYLRAQFLTLSLLFPRQMTARLMRLGKY